MSTTARHGLQTVDEGTTEIDVPFNDLLNQFEAKVACSAKSRTTTAQPAGVEGHIYIIPAGATGAAWSTFNENDVAIFRGGVWVAIAPINGWLAQVEDENDDLYGFGAAGWELKSTTLPKDKLDATVDPTVDEDSGDGYSVGSHWYNVTDDKAFVLLDATVGAAVWKETTAELSGVQNKFDATADPTVDNDTTEGYEVGSRWINVDTDSVFTCADATDGAAVWVSATGLNQSQVDARVVAVAPEASQGNAGPATVFVVGPGIADDGVYELDFGTDVSAAHVIVSNNTNSQYGVFAIRAHSVSAHCVAMVSNNITAQTGVLTGTTGADGQVTISTHTDNKLYLENRAGGTSKFIITVSRTQTP